MNKQKKPSIGFSNRRVTEGGKWVSKERESTIISRNYRVIEHKDGTKSLRRPDGKFTTKREKNIYLEYRREVSLRPKATVTDISEFERGRFLARIYYFNFFCKCELSKDADSPETYIGTDGRRVKEHHFGYSTDSYSSDEATRKRALSAHNSSYPEHKNFHFELITRKRMMI